MLTWGMNNENNFKIEGIHPILIIHYDLNGNWPE